jgi:16S rRNA (cytosine967-C5)-methyltransferase
MIAPARLAAIEALVKIDAGGLDLGEAMARARSALKDERDRALLLELVTGTLRMQAAIDYQLALRVSRPLSKLDASVLRILRLSGFQLLYLSRQPVSAVINDAVHLTKRSGKTSAAGLVNAVLRKLAADRDTLSWPGRDDATAHLATVHSHPAWLVERWIARYGRDATQAWVSFNNEAPSLCLAANRRAISREALAAELLEAGVSTRPTERAPHGLHVIDGHPLALPAFHEGRFVVQDEASQLIAELASPRPGARVLDLCASPGGKTLALSAAVGDAGLVIASDVRPHRIRLLARTLARCRVTNVRVLHLAAEGALPFRDRSFDTVLIDAPCSGLGTIRRDPDIRWRRAPADLPRFAAAQRALLTRAADLVVNGGAVTYSTCSSEPEENQDVVAAFLAERPDFTLERTHETLPFRDRLEAFYGAVLRRASV